MKKVLVIFAVTIFLFACKEDIFKLAENRSQIDYPLNDKPYTRWWWFAGNIDSADIKHELDWLKDKGFGGVELSFIYPVNRDPEAERYPFLGEKWQNAVNYAKSYCDSIGMGCDFTFGTLWPFGGLFVHDSDRTMVYGDTAFKQPLRLSWTHPDTGNVLNHMSKAAFERYAGTMGSALDDALKGNTSALFCDSWEVETRKLWTKGFGDKFEQKYGYRIEPYMDSIYADNSKHERYDYMKLISEMVTANFYAPFAEKCEELGAISRVQCAGSPTDILSAYGLVDVPEGEAMLYDPSYNLIPASAAALSGKNIVSAEAFTCLYGFPDVHFKQEEALDLFMVADALFANGVNMIVWHGKPFNPAGVDTVEFYATTHVGPDGELAPFLKDLNKYMENKAYYMRRGRVYSEAAVYLPWEDALIAGELPEDKQMKWSWGEYEMRYVDMPKELNGFNPLWINGDFLIAAKVKNGKLVVKDQSFSLLYLDAEFLDYTSLKEIYRPANDGMELVLKNVPLEPGRIRHKDYKVMVDELTRMENVRKEIIHKPIVEGDVKFFARKDGDKYFFFFPHPLSYNLKYPLEKGFSFSKFNKKKKVKFNINGKKYERIIEFKYRGIIEPIIE